TTTCEHQRKDSAAASVGKEQDERQRGGRRRGAAAGRAGAGCVCGFASRRVGRPSGLVHSAHLTTAQPSSVSAATAHRNPVSSSHMDAAGSLNDDGVARRNGLVQAPPFSSCRPGFVSVEHHSQTLPHMSNTPYGLTPLW